MRNGHHSREPGPLELTSTPSIHTLKSWSLWLGHHCPLGVRSADLMPGVFWPRSQGLAVLSLTRAHSPPCGQFPAVKPQGSCHFWDQGRTSVPRSRAGSSSVTGMHKSGDQEWRSGGETTAGWAKVMERRPRLGRRAASPGCCPIQMWQRAVNSQAQDGKPGEDTPSGGTPSHSLPTHAANDGHTFSKLANKLKVTCQPFATALQTVLLAFRHRVDNTSRYNVRQGPYDVRLLTRQAAPDLTPSPIDVKPRPLE